MEFYPSVTETILDNALSFSKQHVEISDKDLLIIKHCRKLLLYHENEARKKKNSDSCFYMTIDSYDGAEVCELVDTLVLSTLANSIPKENIGLYWDDYIGLILMRNENGQKRDRIRKEVIKIFKEIGFEIEIKTNLKVVDFLNITFNLSSDIFKPYRKPSNNFSTSSNHPLQIIKQLPTSTAKRLSKNSSSIVIFNSAKVEYENALENNGYYSIKLLYTQTRETNRNITEVETSSGLIRHIAKTS